MSHFINRLFQVLGTGVLVVALTNFLFGKSEPRWIYLLGVAVFIGFAQAVFNVLYTRWKADRPAVPGKDIAAKMGGHNVSAERQEVKLDESSPHFFFEKMQDIGSEESRQRADLLLQNAMARIDRRRSRTANLAAKRKRRNISTLPTPRRP